MSSQFLETTDSFQSLGANATSFLVAYARKLSFDARENATAGLVEEMQAFAHPLSASELA
jgi:hypothetical protein